MEPFRGPVEAARIPAAGWHSIPSQQVLQRLGTSAAGLPAEEVRARRAHHGRNALAEAQPIRPLAILTRHFESLLVGLLIVAALVSGVMGEWLDSSAILEIVVLNARPDRCRRARQRAMKKRTHSRRWCGGVRALLRRCLACRYGVTNAIRPAPDVA